MSIALAESDLVNQTKELVSGRAKVETLPGQFNEQIMAQMLTHAPAVYWSFMGGRRAQNRSRAIKVNWFAYIVTAHASGQQARRLGSKTQIGGYELTELVTGNNFETTSGQLQLEAVENLYSGSFNKKGRLVYLIRYSVLMTFDRASIGFEPGEFLKFRNDMDVNNDGHADAQAHHDFDHDK